MEGGGGKTKAHQEEEEDRRRNSIPIPVLETSVVVPVCQCETGGTECVDRKAEDQKGDEDDKVNDHE